VKPGTAILHSLADDVVPFGDSAELARSSGVPFIEVGSDHRLAQGLRIKLHPNCWRRG
jgi:hypothetical protein